MKDIPISIYQKPVWIASYLAVCAHAMLIPIEFTKPKNPQPPIGIDVTLISQPTTAELSTQSQSYVEPIPIDIPFFDQPTPVVLTTPQAEETIVVTKQLPAEPIQEEVEASPQPEPTGDLAPTFNADNLRMASLKAARNGSFLPQIELAPESIKRKYITANTKELKYSVYQRAWTEKVERVGNLNYPEIVRRENLSGDLIISVGIKHDGSLESIEILRHSGFPQLDEAAIRIVELSAPYAELPAEILEEIDVLHITRTWRFTPEHGLIN